MNRSLEVTMGVRNSVVIMFVVAVISSLTAQTAMATSVLYVTGTVSHGDVPGEWDWSGYQVEVVIVRVPTDREADPPFPSTTNSSAEYAAGFIQIPGPVIAEGETVRATVKSKDGSSVLGFAEEVYLASMGINMVLNVELTGQGNVTLDPSETQGPPTWFYVLERTDGMVVKWSYTGAGITGAKAPIGWDFVQTSTSVTFTADAELGSAPVDGFEISGSAAGVGTWRCGSSSGSIEGSLPVKLSSFTGGYDVSKKAVVISWESESEIDNAGWHVYRAEHVGGPYTRVTTHLLPGAGTSVQRHEYQLVDSDVVEGQIYYYYIEDFSYGGANHRSVDIQVRAWGQALPSQTRLLQNYPNPFNPETWLPFHLADTTDVRLIIYNARGQLMRVLNLGRMSAGAYESRDRAAYWDGRSLSGEPVSNGVYFYQLQAGSFAATRKMLIVK